MIPNLNLYDFPWSVSNNFGLAGNSLWKINLNHLTQKLSPLLFLGSFLSFSLAAGLAPGLVPGALAGWPYIVVCIAGLYASASTTPSSNGSFP